MQVRKDIGNRVIEPSKRPSRGPEYLNPRACFTCRKSWKLSEGSAGKCPECGAQLASMGRNFSAPKKSDADQWKKVEALWHAGFRFVGSVKNYDAEPMPDNLRDVEEFIRENPTHPFRIAQPQ